MKIKCWCAAKTKQKSKPLKKAMSALVSTALKYDTNPTHNLTPIYP